MTEILTAFMPAGGLGSRLRPHTFETPKPMMLMGGADKRVIDHPLEISQETCDEIWVSVDYLGSSIEEYLESRPGVRVVRDGKTVGSGGSLLEHYPKLSDLPMDSDLLVLPSDHIYDGDFDIQKYWNFHRESAADVTLMTVPNKSYGEYLNVDSDNVLSVEKSIGEGSVSSTGTYMFSNKFLMGVLHRMRRNASNELNIYKDIVCPSIGRAAVNHFFIRQDQGYWEDTGTLERYLKSNMRLSDGHNVVSARAQVDDSVDLRRSVVLGNARVEGSVHIEDAIISSNYKGELLISGIDS